MAFMTGCRAKKNSNPAPASTHTTTTSPTANVFSLCVISSSPLCGAGSLLALLLVLLPVLLGGAWVAFDLRLVLGRRPPIQGDRQREIVPLHLRRQHAVIEAVAAVVGDQLVQRLARLDQQRALEGHAPGGLAGGPAADGLEGDRGDAQDGDGVG